MNDARIVAPCTCSRIGGWSAQHRCFLGRYEEILSVAEKVFGDRHKAQHWLRKPVFGLGHQAPCAVLSTSLGYSDAHAVLMRIDHGISC
ncbi:MbcA/ParS/Xre antitoxin family protein [Pseudomonas rhodesiae]|uniref:MbcA/ParS/Xre antitoxin family protein n=1 Tax=Pseudomonas TaxID=286 RepID=UPI0027349E98|nr:MULTISPECIES: MbcA/ParS/Xre antitoxin family protein [Pseudomonas]MEA1031570.1 MbcA/ParS/Xre antitoxin family protein [Pseudomonas sp. N-137]WLI28027.1 MbcA/ParS/Xre antitoxin family protein [Pseudomonas rhodesiae]